MFTGIIEGIGKLVAKRNAGGGMAFDLEAGFDLSNPVEGESIAVNGVCLTAYNIAGRKFTVDVSPESLSRTILGSLSVGAGVNMERALQLSDRLGGHIVSGHVDCVATVRERQSKGDFTLFSLGFPREFGRYVIEKGSIAINGVSLTVNSCSSDTFDVSIIPHTLQETTLGLLVKGSKVNIEVDIIGKYVEKMLLTKDVGEKKADAGNGINPAFLAENGFF
ncbi:MAG TPA: riboflavin synthase [Desulfocapsa sulfexigens]|nr:riboflavin synthase [Desulfocapsa sulfexigens]